VTQTCTQVISSCGRKMTADASDSRIIGAGTPASRSDLRFIPAFGNRIAASRHMGRGIIHPV
jgi:hypothetical protein